MPTAIYELPDGRTARFEVPEGTTQQQAIALGNQLFPPNGSSSSIAGGPELTVPEPLDSGEGSPKRILPAIGEAETALTIGSSMIAEPLAGIAGINQALNPFSASGAGADSVEKVRKVLTFQPRTEGGKETLKGFGEALEPVGKFLQATEEFAGDIGFNIAGPIGGATGAAIPTAAMEALGFKGTRLARGSRKIQGITDDVAESLAKAGIDIDDLSDANIAKIQERIAIEAQERAARAQAFEDVDIAPTRAEITRSRADFQRQQDLVRSGDAPEVEGMIAGREGQLLARTDQAVAETGGQAVTDAPVVQQALSSKAGELSDQIASLYKEAREVASATPIEVNIQPMADLVASIKGKDKISGGLFSSVKQDLINSGLVDADLRVVRKATIEEAEILRQGINSVFDSITGEGRRLSRSIKELLDEQVFRAAGADIFNKARSAKSNFERGLSTAKLDRFDTRDKHIVRDIIEGGIDPERIVDDVVKAKKWRGPDLKKLKQYLTSGTPSQIKAGKKAWDDLRSETLADIRNKAFGLTESKAEGILSRRGIDNAINKIGNEKLSVLFSPAERKFLKDMQKVAALKEAPPGKALGSGPSAPAIQKLTQSIKGQSVLAALFGRIKTSKQGKIVLDIDVLNPRIRIKEPTIDRALESGAALSPGASTSGQEDFRS